MRGNFAILLAGCGPYDGTDPAEAILIMSALARREQEFICLTLDIPQDGVSNHGTGMVEEDAAPRNVAEESARLARGKIFPLSEFTPGMMDGLFIPGGQGVVKNFIRNFYSLEAPREVHPELQEFLLGAREKNKVIGVSSLAEFIITDLFGDLARNCLEMAGSEVFVDPEKRILLTPGHTRAKTMAELTRGMDNLVDAMLAEVEKSRPRNPLKILNQ